MRGGGIARKCGSIKRQEAEPCQDGLCFYESRLCIRGKRSFPERTLDDQAETVKAQRIVKHARADQRVVESRGVPGIRVFHEGGTIFMSGNVIAHSQQDRIIQGCNSGTKCWFLPTVQPTA